MVDYLHRPVCHEAFFKKYASKKFLKGEALHYLGISCLYANTPQASIMTRQWAKKYHHMYIDSALSEPYSSIKDHE